MVAESIKPVWDGTDIFVLGGGPSLIGFPFHLLAEKNTIGANDSFRLGPSICKVCIFGDKSWWQTVKFDLEEYGKSGGIVYSICPGTESLRIPYVSQLIRAPHGLESDTHLSWNFSTGAAAVNLALNMGAKRVFLLGFDMTGKDKSRKGDYKISHWHEYRYRPYTITDASFTTFLRGFKSLAQAAKQKFPNVEILNVGDGTSKLEEFRKITFDEMWELVNGTGS